MNDDADNVTALPVKFKPRLPGERTLIHPFEVKGAGRCKHYQVQYIVDQAAAEVECGSCGEKLNAMWVLSMLATEDRRMAEYRERYKDEQKRLAERARTKCQHCGGMTRISRA